MNPAIIEQKADLRRRLRSEIAAIPSEAWETWSRQAGEILEARPEWAGARRLLFYHPIRRELDLRLAWRGAMRTGRLVALPRFSAARGEYEAAWIKDEARDIQPGWAGIPEPGPACVRAPLNQLDLVFVPGVGFDPDGGRLGRGRGFYDRLLQDVRGVRCGVAGDGQVVRAIPTQPHDELVDCILTPTRWIVCRPRAVWK